MLLFNYVYKLQTKFLIERINNKIANENYNEFLFQAPKKAMFDNDLTCNVQSLWKNMNWLSMLRV